MIPLHLSPFANHLWQSTLFTGMAAVLTLALRQNRAPVRYRLWLAASIKFLIPFSLLQTLGGQFEWRTAQAMAPPLSLAIESISQPFAAPIPALGTNSMVADWPLLPGLLIAVWFCGCTAVAAHWYVRWRRVRLAVRNSLPSQIEGPIEVRTSRTRLEPGIFGVFRPVLLLPEGIREHLPPAQFQAILAHEFCHVRRRDNLAASIHMLVEAVFWFHPLVWWIGGRLVEERERACDEEVLRLGSQPEDYAAGILNVCRFYLESPLVCASGVTGSDLKKRVEAIMTKRTLYGLTFTRKLLLATAVIFAVAAPIVIGIAKAQMPVAPLRFEVASIKPAKDAGGRGGLQILPGGGLRMDGVTLQNLVSFAYDVREVSGGPKWAGSDAYNVLAKPEHSALDDNPKNEPGPGTAAWDRVRLRTQTLLAERFQLVVHKNSKVESGYALVVAKGGTKLQQSTASRPPGTLRGTSRIDSRYGTMHMLVTVLSEYLGNPVEDRTALSGNYDYKLDYAPDTGPGVNPPDVPGPSIFTALEEQLGLKLEPARVTRQAIVIEKAEKPSAN